MSLVLVQRNPAMENRGRLLWWTAFGTLTFSAFCVLWIGRDVTLGLPDAAADLSGQLWPLLFPCLLGFLLCPYLDLTFHRARRSMSSRQAKLGFTLGFGVFFLSMILLTLAYSGVVADLLSTETVGAASVVGLLTLHVGLQTYHTLHYHASEVKESVKQRLIWAVPWAFVAGGLVAVVPLLVRSELQVADMSIGELIYRCFMVFYGLVFPAYVWLCMLPTRDGHSGIKGRDGRRNRLVLAGVIGLAVPFYWMGFIERQEPWLIGGVAVVLLGRLFVGRSGMSKAVQAADASSS